jgi:hypothetical protein
MMSLRSVLHDIADKAAESSKATAVVSAYSTAAGVATLQQWITGIGSTLAVFAGLIGVLILARLNYIKSENEKIRGRILREKATELGIDLSED